MTEKMFPVLLGSLAKEYPDCPRSIPWAVLEPHREQAKKNHDQTLERLAERGGLDPREIRAVIEHRSWRNEFMQGQGNEEASRMRESVDLIKRIAAEHLSKIR